MQSIKRVIEAVKSFVVELFSGLFGIGALIGVITFLSSLLAQAIALLLFFVEIDLSISVIAGLLATFISFAFLLFIRAFFKGRWSSGKGWMGSQLSTKKPPPFFIAKDGKLVDKTDGHPYATVPGTPKDIVIAHNTAIVTEIGGRYERTLHPIYNKESDSWTDSRVTLKGGETPAHTLDLRLHAQRFRLQDVRSRDGIRVEVDFRIDYHIAHIDNDPENKVYPAGYEYPIDWKSLKQAVYNLPIFPNLGREEDAEPRRAVTYHDIVLTKVCDAIRRVVVSDYSLVDLYGVETVDAEEALPNQDAERQAIYDEIAYKAMNDHRRIKNRRIAMRTGTGSMNLITELRREHGVDLVNLEIREIEIPGAEAMLIQQWQRQREQQVDQWYRQRQQIVGKALATDRADLQMQITKTLIDRTDKLLKDTSLSETARRVSGDVIKILIKDMVAFLGNDNVSFDRGSSAGFTSSYSASMGDEDDADYRAAQEMLKQYGGTSLLTGDDDETPIGG